MARYMRRLTPGEMELVTGGKKLPAGQAIFDLCAWVACGFHHRYALTGKTKQDIDLVFPVTFYQVKCLDCGHVTWQRSNDYVQGPKINPEALPKP